MCVLFCRCRTDMWYQIAPYEWGLLLFISNVLGNFSAHCIPWMQVSERWVSCSYFCPFELCFPLLSLSKGCVVIELNIHPSSCAENCFLPADGLWLHFSPTKKGSIAYYRENMESPFFGSACSNHPSGLPYSHSCCFSTTLSFNYYCESCLVSLNYHKKLLQYWKKNL